MPDIMSTLEKKQFVWVPALAIPAAIVFTYWQTIQSLYDQWMNNEDFSHGLLIVPIALYLAWKKKDTLARIRFRTDWRALFLFVFAILAYTVGELGAELFTTRVSMLLFVFATVWLLFGWETFKTLCFPLLFLLLMLPLPGFIYRNMTFPLQIISSKFSVDLLNLFGIMAYREGNVIDMGFTQLQVVEACNGLRFIMPLFTVGILFAFAEPKIWWKRAILVLSTIPFAIGANIIRIAGTGVVSLFWGAKAAEGFFHSFSGWAVFMICFGVFWCLYLLVKKLPGEPPAARQTPVERPAVDGPALHLKPVPIVLAFLLVCSASFFVSYLGQVPPRPLEKDLALFPMTLDGWTGEKDSMEADVWEQVGGQHYVMINYAHPGEQPVGFYTAYYEYQRKAGDFIHSPKLCLPGAGWFIDENLVRTLSYEGLPAPDFGDTLTFNDMVISKGESRQLVYYWYQGRQRNFTNEYLAKFYMIWDGIWRRRTDGALVRLIRPMGAQEPTEAARKVLDRFALRVSSELDGYLP